MNKIKLMYWFEILMFSIYFHLIFTKFYGIRGFSIKGLVVDLLFFLLIFFLNVKYFFVAYENAQKLFIKKQSISGSKLEEINVKSFFIPSLLLGVYAILIYIITTYFIQLYTKNITYTSGWIEFLVGHRFTSTVGEALIVKYNNYIILIALLFLLSFQFKYLIKPIKVNKMTIWKIFAYNFSFVLLISLVGIMIRFLFLIVVFIVYGVIS